MRRGERRPAYRDPGAPPPGVAVHFWPGEHPAGETPGAILPCGTKATPPFGSSDPAAVTCKRCQRWLASDWAPLRSLNADGKPWPRYWMEKAGLLDPSAPEWKPRPPPYRNPRLPVYERGSPGPVAELADRLARLAEEARAAGRLEAFQAYRNAAAQAADLHDTTRAGAPW